MMASELQTVGTRKQGPVSTLKRYFGTDQIKARFNDILGKKSGAFCSSIINVVSNSEKLQKCNADSIMGAALVAATLDLPIDPNLSFAAIVPYGDKAQFQIMYRGLVQLAVRSGQYSEMNCTEIYEDELIMYNPIRGTCQFETDFTKTKQRMNGESDKVVGYYAYFKLGTGFEKELYMSKAEIEAHANKYSKMYQSDKKYGKSSSKWSTDFDAMGKKTVLKMLLSKWGPLSTDMQNAVINDQKVFASEGRGEYVDNPVDVEARDVHEENRATDFEQMSIENVEEEIDITK